MGVIASALHKGLDEGYILSVLRDLRVKKCICTFLRFCVLARDINSTCGRCCHRTTKYSKISSFNLGFPQADEREYFLCVLRDLRVKKCICTFCAFAF